MIVILSPSKTINPKPAESSVVSSRPVFKDESEELAGVVSKLGKKLASTLGVSEKLAEENRVRLANWSSDPNDGEGAMAAWAYRGETFFGLSIEQMDQESRGYAQDHLFIVTGLYGLLRPQDIIMPYRLEMSTKLSGKWGRNLYDFWGNKLAKEIQAAKPEFILNCASKEYSRAALKGIPKDMRIITPKFLSESPSGLRSKMVFAKYSRGLMARWAIENRITNPEDLKRFDMEGYVFSPDHSTEDQYAFIAPSGFTIKGRFTKK